MADLTILIKYHEDDIYYSVDEGKKYRVLEEDTVIGADREAKITWQCADDSIEKITNLVVNLQKGDSNQGKPYKYVDLWQNEPRVVEGTEDKCWSGVVIDVPKGEVYRNGWTICYRTKDGVDREKDPDTEVPPSGGPH